MTRHSLKTVLVAVILTAGCSDPTQPPVEPIENAARELLRFPDCEGPATSVDPAFDITLPLETYLRNHELFAALAKEVPGGFAGVFQDKAQPVLLLTDPSRETEAKAALAPYFINLYGIDMATVEVRRARWDFAQLANWHTYLFRHTPVPATRGLTYNDTDVTLNRILLGVKDAEARDRLRAVLAGIDLPCDLMLLEIRDEVVMVPLGG
ncbi:MAG: hypothetical protein NUW01_07850 [Gemmatimonadaceae bacterium]|nr:hypothetical protein [Gemmatimonadaceae bacterium]